MNAYAERFVRSIKEEALSRIIFFGEASLRRAIQNYMTHYLAERNHQGIDNPLITASNVIALTEGAVKRRNRLGDMLRFYLSKSRVTWPDLEFGQNAIAPSVGTHRYSAEWQVIHPWTIA